MGGTADNWPHAACDGATTVGECPFWNDYDRLTAPCVAATRRPPSFWPSRRPFCARAAGSNQTVVNVVLRLVRAIAASAGVPSDHVIDVFSALGGSSIDPLPRGLSAALRSRAASRGKHRPLRRGRRQRAALPVRPLLHRGATSGLGEGGGTAAAPNGGHPDDAGLERIAWAVAQAMHRAGVLPAPAAGRRWRPRRRPARPTLPRRSSPSWRASRMVTAQHPHAPLLGGASGRAHCGPAGA